MQVESLKYDLGEKSELLSEASQAIDQLEDRLKERDEERFRLEEKLQQVEEEMSDANFLVRENYNMTAISSATTTTTTTAIRMATTATE